MPVASLASTARWIAAVRAHESRREDRLFHDPWAAALAGAEGEAWIAGRGNAPALAAITIRARYFDDYLERVTDRHGVRQVVLVAAGFDTRAYRLSWPEGTRVFELEQPEVLGDKERILRAEGARPTCERQAVGADLMRSWTEPLARAGYRRSEPSCWLFEGFLFYLDLDRVSRILDETTAVAATGSWLGFDMPNAITLTHAYTRSWVDMQARMGVPFVATLDDPSTELASRGWIANQVQVGDREANFGRWPYPPIPLEVPDMPRNWLVTAVKDEA